ncbi:L-type lectin-domain containing receptor kinase VIII.2-like protein [Tanacetum coccineum]
MASIHTSRYFLLTLLFIALNFKSLYGSSFYLKNFGKDSNFSSILALYGDANVTNHGLSLQLTKDLSYSVGRVIYKNPIKFYAGVPKKKVSFSTFFDFSMSKSGEGLAFVVLGDGYDVDRFDDNGSFGVASGDEFKFVSVEFDTFMDDKYGDVNGNHVGIDVSSFVSLKVVNLSSVGLGLSSGDRLQVWIDYKAGSRRLEVRMSKSGQNRPVDPLLFARVDLSKIWPENEGFHVGLSSANGNSSQSCNVYSWSFKTREAPDWMHSEPLDPIVYKDRERIVTKEHKRSDCVLRILSALILGIGLGALGSFIGLFMWTILANRRPVAPEEYAVKPKPVVHDKALANEK